MIEYRREKAAVAAYDGDKRIGECTFTVENDVWNLEHTFVDKAYGGQGIAGKLVEGVCEAAREQGAFVRPVCSYAVHLFEKKPDVYSSVAAYDFYGWRSAPVHPVGEGFKGVRDQKHLYALLKKLWTRETCAPRLRDKWSAENPTLGQCSITAFLAQDIFGGKVRGIVLPDGSSLLQCSRFFRLRPYLRTVRRHRARLRQLRSGKQGRTLCERGEEIKV